MATVSMLDRQGRRAGAPYQDQDPQDPYHGYQGGDGYGDDDYLGWDDEDEFVTVRSSGYRVLRAVLALVVLLVIGFLLVSGVRGWFRSQLDPSGPQGEAIALTVPAGATTGDIAQQLEDEGIIPNSTFFRYYADWKGYGNFQAGEYEMKLNSSADEAIAVLQAGPIPPKYRSFLIPEGKWVSEMLPKIAEQIPGMTAEQLQAVLDSGQIVPRYRPDGVTSWEGLLFPATYEIEDDATPAEVIAKMNDEFARVTGELGYGGAEAKVGLSAYDVIKVASMIEAEAKTDGDRAKIARVIYNRLKEQMSLDIDAICLYGANTRDPGILTRKFLDNEGSTGPYACRKDVTLPATPIAAPGRASLEAALNPAEGNWLYYVVADTEGNHFFTDNYDDFINQVNKSKDEGLF